VCISQNLTKDWGKDPRQIVIDEYATLLLPLYFTPKRIVPLIITFLLFRFFDIVKPPPLRKLETIPGGWGIMLDDLGAAVYTTIVILIIAHFFTI
jgi:phosphatidylglycerophosphatase A